MGGEELAPPGHVLQMRSSHIGMDGKGPEDQGADTSLLKGNSPCRARVVCLLDPEVQAADFQRLNVGRQARQGGPFQGPEDANPPPPPPRGPLAKRDLSKVPLSGVHGCRRRPTLHRHQRCPKEILSTLHPNTIFKPNTSPNAYRNPNED